MQPDVGGLQSFAVASLAYGAWCCVVCGDPMFNLLPYLPAEDTRGSAQVKSALVVTPAFRNRCVTVDGLAGNPALGVRAQRVGAVAYERLSNVVLEPGDLHRC